MGKWEMRLVCRNCDWWKLHDYDSTWLGAPKVCPNCGSFRGDFGRNYRLETIRLVMEENFRWWNPWTWNMQHWEDRSGKTISDFKSDPKDKIA